MLSTQHFTIGPAHFGWGAIGKLPTLLHGLSQNGAFLVTDRGLAAAGISGEIELILQSAGIQVTVFDDVHTNPDTETLSLGAQLLRESDAGTVVALGGGSVLDAAKGIALMAPNEGSACDFDYRNEPERPGLPVIAIPTTAGTGSETNGFGVIEDRAAERKFYIGHASVVPRSVILDPDLTRDLPPRPTAATGMDVLAHALESLSSRRNNPYAEGISVQVVRVVSRFLRKATSDGQNHEARAQMLLAAHMAGLAFGTTGLGMAHAVAHGLSARLGTAHGVALAVILPHVLAFNLPVCADRYTRVAQALDIDGSKADAVIDHVRQLSRELGMPGTLQELGCAREMISALSEKALADEVSENAPRLPTPDKLRVLLEAAL